MTTQEALSIYLAQPTNETWDILCRAYQVPRPSRVPTTLLGVLWQLIRGHK